MSFETVKVLVPKKCDKKSSKMKYFQIPTYVNIQKTQPNLYLLVKEGCDIQLD